MKHNYKPLTTFRGWSEEENRFVYGDLFHHVFDVAIQPLHSPNYFNVNKDSIGIYTGKDDANGTPIFCGVDGASYGGDYFTALGAEFICRFYCGRFVFQSEELGSDDVVDIAYGIEVKSQYEQHLKENSR